MKLGCMHDNNVLLESGKIQEENLKQMNVLNARKEIGCLLLMKKLFLKIHGYSYVAIYVIAIQLYDYI